MASCLQALSSCAKICFFTVMFSNPASTTMSAWLRSNGKKRSTSQRKRKKQQTSTTDHQISTVDSPQVTVARGRGHEVDQFRHMGGRHLARFVRGATLVRLFDACPRGDCLLWRHLQEGDGDARVDETHRDASTHGSCADVHEMGRQRREFERWGRR